jgi:glycosyltransferase involved in cell wall biosynthesis
MAQYALLAQESSPQAKLILDQHNAVYLIPQRMAGEETNFLKQKFLAGESRRLAAYELEMWRRFDQVVWVTAEDRQAVAKLSGPNTNGHAPSTIIPICADPGQVAPIETRPEAQRITFIGGLHWPPNAQGVLWFAQEIFPRIRAKLPQAVLTVIGKNPPLGLTGEGVETTGYVVDPTSYLAETAVFIVPLLAGGGMRVKILDAWSWGLPMVSTTIGAEGIEVTPGKDILIADEPEAFAQAVIQVFQNLHLAQQLKQNGRATLLEKYNWQVRYNDWNQVYE